MRLKPILVSLAVVSLFAVPGITWAASIAIETLLTNASFEDGSNLTCPTAWTCAGSGGAAAYSPIDAQYIKVTDDIPGHVPDGLRAAYAPIDLGTAGGSGSLQQITTSTWASGNTYSFTFWVGVPLTWTDGSTGNVTGPLGAVSISLLANGIAGNFCGGKACTFDVLAAGLPTLGHWKQFTYNFSIDSSADGETIGLVLQEDTTGANQAVNWDMGATETTPVPEPATMFLGGLGLIALGFAARRRLFGR